MAESIAVLTCKFRQIPQTRSLESLPIEQEMCKIKLFLEPLLCAL